MASSARNTRRFCKYDTFIKTLSNFSCFYLAVLDDDNIIRTIDQSNCCENGGIGQRYYTCMQMHKDKIAQVGFSKIFAPRLSDSCRWMQKAGKVKRIHPFSKDALEPQWK